MNTEPNTNTNTIRVQNFGRIRIRIVFGFRNFGRVQIGILFGVPLLSEFKYEYLKYSNNTEYKYKYTRI